VIDGQPVAAIAEERLNRVKYYAAFPKLAVQQVLDMGGIRLRDVDVVAVGYDLAANRQQKIGYALRNPGKLLNLAAMATARKDTDDLRGLIGRELGVDADEMRFRQINVEHHLAHIASAYFISPWDYAAGFSMDGSGDFVSCMLAECKGDQIEVKQRVYLPHSLGTLYTMVCDFIGYGKYGDEGKVMGLAPYGETTYLDTFRQMIHLTDSAFELNPDYFVPFGANAGIQINDSGVMEVSRLYSETMIDTFGAPREPYTDIPQRDRDLAFGVQSVFEDVYMHMLNRLHGLVPTERVAMAGGAVLNSVANGKLFDQTPFTETAIQPAAGDEGLALGAALYASQAELKDGERFVMTNSYLGPEYSRDEIRAALDDANVEYEELDDNTLLDRTADEIAVGNVVGWFQGRMEWGPRALGNRSILANPALNTMKDTLNARIKRREWFRPFAPSVLAEHQGEIFEKDYPSPFMLHVYKIQPEWRDKLPAVNHVDDTGRLQTVTAEANPRYHALISRFHQKTGVPVVLNTSFNENEPIVCNPTEAVDCYLRTHMDTIAIGNFFARKAARPTEQSEG
ncbi:MAG: carbamoyltransferase C-terminal domain-containing protein, partial [Chloroflexota bacterium]